MFGVNTDEEQACLTWYGQNLNARALALEPYKLNN